MITKARIGVLYTSSRGEWKNAEVQSYDNGSTLDINVSARNRNEAGDRLIPGFIEKGEEAAIGSP